MQHSIMLSDKAVEALIAFSWYRCDTKPNLEIAKHAMSMAKTSGDKRYIASALWCLGTVYHYLGEFYDAYDRLHEAYQLFNTLLPGDLELQRFCCQCGIEMVVGARMTFNDHIKVASLARDVEKQCANVSDDIRVRSLIMLGTALMYSGDRQEALRHLEDAKLRLKAMGCFLLTEVCFWIAHVHYGDNRLPEALDAVKEAWEHAELSNNLMDRSETSFLFGMILFSANRDAEAWKYMEICLMTNLELGNRRDCATALEYMGYGYLRIGDYVNAYGAYEAAAEKYRGTVDEEIWGTTCKDNMAKIRDKQRNPDLNIGFERPGRDKDRCSLFYPAVQDIP